MNDRLKIGDYVREPHRLEKSKIRSHFGRILRDDTGAIFRLGLERGLRIAYAGDDKSGKLTLSRPCPQWPSPVEIGVIRRDFRAACGDAGRGLGDIAESGRLTRKNRNMIRYDVQFAEQGVLFDD